MDGRLRAAGATLGIALSLAATIAIATPEGSPAAPRKPSPAVSGQARAAAVPGADRHKRGGRRLFWGAWIGDQITGTAPPYDMSAARKFERVVRKRMSLLEFAVPFADCSSGCNFFDFPTQEMEKIRRHGAIPFLSWSSQAIGVDPIRQPAFQLSDVIRGRYDAHIRRFARFAKRWGHPFFLRFNWEMNGNWFPWGLGANGNRPGQFVPAWRHVERIFNRVGARKVTWVWCPYSDANRKQNLRRLYPGNRWVDWTCLDVYNWGRAPANPHAWMNFKTLFRSNYRRVAHRIAPHKPMVVGETASSDFGGNKAVWIRRMFRGVLHRYRKVRALIYFDVNDRGTHWPIETSHSATRAFRHGVRRPGFVGSRFSHLRGRVIRPPR
jgi:hypothetical protein